jgi:hypothetical protein
MNVPSESVGEELKRAVEDGKVAFADWPGSKPPEVDHSLVEKHVLRCKAVSGVRIKGAVIKGMLDLRDGRGPSGEPCSALILENCVLKGDPDADGSHPGIDASHSHLQRLCLVGCETNGVELSGAVIVGDLNLDGLRPVTLTETEALREVQGDRYSRERRACWVKSRGIRVGGSVTARRATLSLPWLPGSEWPPEDAGRWSELRAPFGLDLEGAQIVGSLVLQPGFGSGGGVSIAGATIGGSLWAQGAYLEAAGVGQGSVEALRAQSVEIQGHAMFSCDLDYISKGGRGARGRFDARGKLDFLSAKIGGWLLFSGAKVTYEGDPALYLYSAAVSTDVRLDSDCDAGMPCDIPTIDLSSSEITGKLLIEGSNESPIRRVDATGVRTGSDLDVLGSVSQINMGTATIGGALQIQGHDVDAIERVDATGVRTARGLTLAGSVATTDLKGSIIDGDVEIRGTSDAPIYTVHATGLRAHGSLRLSGHFAGTCDFGGSVIDGDVELGIEGSHDRGSADDPLILDATRSSLQPKLVFERASVGGALKVAPSVTLWSTPTKKPAFRTADLSCYPGWRLAEASLLSDDESAVELFAFLYRSDHKSTIVILNGKADPIHRLNDWRPPVLGNEQQVKQYLSLFCTYVWGDEGAFEIDDIRDLRRPPGDAAVEAAVREIGHEPEDGSWQAAARVEYGKGIFEVTFLVEPSGSVWMIEDNRIEMRPEGPVRYEPPVRRVRVESRDTDDRHWPIPPPREFEFTVIETDEKGNQQRTQDGDVPDWEDVQRAFRRDLEQQPRASIDLQKTRPSIDLRGLRAGSLSDGEGTYWGLALAEEESPSASPKLWLRLSGFEYGRIDRLPPPDQEQRGFSLGESEGETDRESGQSDGESAMGPADYLRYRRSWLRAQYKRYPPDDREYRPQPYQQLARVWRAEGRFDEADHIAHDKLEVEKVLLVKTEPESLERWHRARLLWHRAKQFLWKWFVMFPFGFGLRPRRAAASFGLYWLAGFLALLALSGALKIDASAVATVVANDGTDRVVVDQRNIPGASEEIPCGNYVNKAVYPLDVMIPLLDLREESRCQLSIEGGWWVFDWGLLKGLYAVGGWLMLTGLIVTLSGVVRRRIEG